jgi:nucleotide-binding universal stress UspA family protein
MVELKRVLVPLDFGETTQRTLHYARSVAERFSSSLDVLHVAPNPYVADPSGLYSALPQAFLDSLERDLRERMESILDASDRKRFSVTLDLEIGDPLVNIVEYARRREVDLIVMGTHGRTGMAHLFLGSVAERVVRTAPCPVLTVR